MTKKILVRSMLASMFIVGAISYSLATHSLAGEGDIEMCKGSGEHCMTVDLGSGMSAKLVKTKGSPAVIVKQ